jgi:general secretion pathway protein I
MNASMISSGRQRGFTLLEVLIALAIVAMSVGALLGTITSSASNVIYLKDKTLAEWVALNRLTEVRIDQNMPGVGARIGNSVMGGQRWEWKEEVIELPIKGMFRVEVRAHPTGELVDDSRPVDKPTEQKLSPSTSAGTAKDSIAWTTSVVGVVGSARSDIRDSVAYPFEGMQQTPQNPGGNPANTPAPPKSGAPSP